MQFENRMVQNQKTSHLLWEMWMRMNSKHKQKDFQISKRNREQDCNFNVKWICWMSWKWEGNFTGERNFSDAYDVRPMLEGFGEERISDAKEDGRRIFRRTPSRVLFKFWIVNREEGPVVQTVLKRLNQTDKQIKSKSAFIFLSVRQSSSTELSFSTKFFRYGFMKNSPIQPR